MGNAIYSEVEFVKKELTKMGAFVSGNKINGAITAQIFSENISDTLIKLGVDNLFKISENNVYILGCDCEFDFLLLKKEAKKIMNFPIYKLEDVVAIVESKTSGVFSVKKDGEISDLKKLVSSFNEFNKVKSDISLGYMTMAEHIPVKNSSLNFWEETKRYLETNVEGNWVAYAASLYTSSVENPVEMATDEEFVAYVKYLCGIK